MWSAASNATARSSTPALSRDELDDHFSSLARLAEVLGRHGQALEPGFKVITGAFTRNEMVAGDEWRAVYSGVGEARISIA